MVSYVLFVFCLTNLIMMLLRPIHVAVNGHICSFCGWVMFHCVKVYIHHIIFTGEGASFQEWLVLAENPGCVNLGPRAELSSVALQDKEEGVGVWKGSHGWTLRSPASAGWMLRSNTGLWIWESAWYPCRKTWTESPSHTDKEYLWETLTQICGFFSSFLFPCSFLLSLPPLSSLLSLSNDSSSYS